VVDIGELFLYKLERTSYTPTMTVQHSFVFLKTSVFHDIWNGRLSDWVKIAVLEIWVDSRWFYARSEGPCYGIYLFI
jgi:hypothetical protein